MPRGKGRNRQRTRRSAKPKISRPHRIAEARLRKRRGLVALMAGLALLVAFDSYLLFSQNPARFHMEDVRQTGPPIIHVTPRVYDFGTLSRARGVVTAELALENTGGSDLVITGMRTSCGCTRVSLISHGKESPLFGMHNNPVGWEARLAPREKARLKVYYDPNVHSQLRGPVIRKIQIFSNDPGNEAYMVRIQLVQTE